MSAHPRSRGENAQWKYRASRSCGSSPLTRGKLTYAALKPTGLRLIPAHAGKTIASWAIPRPWSAHPRSRGENLEDARTDHLHDGSSPLTRGKRLHAPRHLVNAGLIPAHAGKTRPTASSHPASTAHPRSRGENAHDEYAPPPLSGSSPLTRGKLPSRLVYPNFTGLIPAHAGKTALHTGDRPSNWAHPRSRGENPMTREYLGAADGSSPLTRGKLIPVFPSATAPGLIPAHAGKTGVCRAYPACSTAHPRSRGENVRTRRTDWHAAGSSPLTRGKL